MLPEPKINEKIIDTHLHIEAWKNEEAGSFLNGFELYRNGMDLNAINICSLNNHARGVANNIMIALYKLVNKNTYAHGALDHIVKPMGKNPDGMDLVTQYKELMEIGFDGIKLIEGKPTVLKPLGGTLLTPYFDELFSEIEKDGTHVVFHVNDPDEFWDEELAPEWSKKAGWFYGDGTYPNFFKVRDEILAILDKYPKLNVTFAHFFFYSKWPNLLEDMFSKYENMAVDITPGTEMFFSFEDNHDFYKEFFEKHSNRIMVGTDATFPWQAKDFSWCIDKLYRFIATDEKFMSFGDRYLTGLNLTGLYKENILWRNFERRVGHQKPKEINKEKLLSYFEKYKSLLDEEEYKELSPLVDKYLR